MKTGSGGRTRTCDHPLKRGMLYLLSYTGINSTARKFPYTESLGKQNNSPKGKFIFQKFTQQVHFSILCIYNKPTKKPAAGAEK